MALALPPWQAVVPPAVEASMPDGRGRMRSVLVGVWSFLALLKDFLRTICVFVLLFFRNVFSFLKQIQGLRLCLMRAYLCAFMCFF